MSKYTLHYFNSAGRGETVRIIFHHAGVEFTDHRIERSEWPEIKKDNRLFPFGQVPTLEVDGTVIAQSMAIVRYLGDEFGLAGKSNLERARVNMIADGLTDLFNQFAVYFRETDEVKKAELLKAFLEIHLPQVFSVIEKLLSENNGGKGYFVGDTVTWVDILFFDFSCLVDKIQSNLVDKYTLLKGLQERVSQLPKIKAYLDAR